MNRNSEKYRTYVNVLHEELVPAIGCTEPIAVAYAAAKCRQVLGALPESCTLVVSGAIIKNTKGAVVPNTGGRKGLKTAVAAGVVAGKAEALLEVLACITPQQFGDIASFIEVSSINIKLAIENKPNFYIEMMGTSEEHTARVIIENFHTNITLVERDDETIFKKSYKDYNEETDKIVLDVADILEFANTVVLEDVRDIIKRQIEFNSAISQEGLKGGWGAEIGRTFYYEGKGNIVMRARAVAAAGSDARMSGCELPVIIASGSGNQGLTASLPVIEYAHELHFKEECLYRALVLSSLLTIHQKTRIGRLSAFCGAVSAGAAAGCGIAYLMDGDLDTINHTLVNALAICSGMVCDGAKPSCAAKISAAVDAGITGYIMYKNGHQFYNGDGIVKTNVENTILAVGDMARKGMKETDRRILRIMLED